MSAERVTVTYKDSTGKIRVHTGFSHIFGAGVVLVISTNNQVFIPWGRVYEVDQFFNGGVEPQERYNRALIQIFTKIDR